MNQNIELTMNNFTTSNREIASEKNSIFSKNSILKVIQTVKSESPFLYVSVLITLILAVGATIGLLVDDRILNGVNVWLKPLKFAISSVIYVMTFCFLMTLYPYSNRKKKILNNVIAVTMLLDIFVIFIQGARGVQSHYNLSSPIDGLLYATMGISISIVVIIMLISIIDTIRLKMKTTKAIQWAILLGWLVVFFGSWVGGQMISQLSHSVAIADGEAGLPFLNWSTIAGDLRVAHFFGLHGIQIIPLFAYWVSNKWKSSSRKQILIVTLFGLSYAAWMGFTFYQAKQGMALLSL